MIRKIAVRLIQDTENRLPQLGEIPVERHHDVDQRRPDEGPGRPEGVRAWRRRRAGAMKQSRNMVAGRSRNPRPATSDDNSGNADVWLIVPVYNEAPVIGDVIANASHTFGNIVCVDDGSTDGSAEQIRAAAGGARVGRHPVNLGQGAAIQTGIECRRARLGRGTSSPSTPTGSNASTTSRR